MASSAEQRSGPPFGEFDVVRTRATISANGHTYPSGSIGAIVLVHRNGRSFEVEISEPRPLVVMLEEGDIELVP